MRPRNPRTAYLLTALLALFLARAAHGQDVLIPMDASQTDHLKAYGVAFWVLQQGGTVEWLLNYRGGAFLAASTESLERELRIRDVAYQKISPSESARILAEVEGDETNTSSVRLEKAPRIAVYAPDQTLPWDDAVMLALNYAEVPYKLIYDSEVLAGDLADYDWLHLHHEDFTGQYGKFYAMYRNHPWYVEQQRLAEDDARRHGFRKVSQLKLAVAQTIRDYVVRGGFLFAMCSGTDTFDIALSAHDTDITPAPFDGDAVDPDAMSKLDFTQTLAFQDFTPSFNPLEYEHSNIDVMPPPQLQRPELDYFTLFEFSAKWDPVPTMLTQNHVSTIKGFMGQTTSFDAKTLKPTVVVLGQFPGRDYVRYLHGTAGMGTFAFYAGHDPEDYKHHVGDPPTELALHKNSPGYRLILNNVLFPAARKKKQKT